MITGGPPPCSRPSFLGWWGDIPCVDSLTHAFVVVLAAAGTLSRPFLFILVLGSVFPDVDILFKPLSDRYPSLYLFTHGGIAHSILGVLAMAPLVLIGVFLAASAGFFPDPGQGFSWVQMGILFISGGLTHLFLDALACPGIPLFYPFSSKKYTACIFPGPSLVLFAASLLFAAMIFTRHGGPEVILAYASGSALFILSSGIIALVVARRVDGKAIPTFNPLRWLVFKDDGKQYLLSWYSPLSVSDTVISFPKYVNTTLTDLEPLVRQPEYQRLRFYSYAVCAEQDGDHIIFFDPLRSGHFIFYPPYYTRIVLPAQDNDSLRP